MPLKAYKNMTAYKLFVLDVGLLGAMSELPAESILEGNDIFVEFKGALTEQNIRSQSLKTYCEKFQPEEAVRFSTLKCKEQDWMVNIPLYAVCNL